MDKVSDAVVAKALNYNPWGGMPKWTTDLNAIVAEYTARGLGYNLDVTANTKGKTRAYAQVLASGNPDGRGETAPKALCAALLAFLGERHA